MLIEQRDAAQKALYVIGNGTGRAKSKLDEKVKNRESGKKKSSDKSAITLASARVHHSSLCSAGNPRDKT